jgi:transposase
MNRHQRLSRQRREQRKVRYEAVLLAHRRGLSERAIASELGLSRKTVRRFLRAGQFPERAPRHHPTGLAPFRDFLQKRWSEGCHNAAQLWRELRQQGYSGQRSRVKEFLHAWRCQPIRHSPKGRKLPNPHRIAFWLSQPSAQRRPEQQDWIRVLTDAHPDIGRAEHLAQRFRELFRNRSADGLDAWLAAARQSGVAELQGFAAGIQRDRAAVAAGMEQHWSNAQVEGQVHRLKFLKRQMYGRAGFLLLRCRVLPFRGRDRHQAARSP